MAWHWFLNGILTDPSQKFTLKIRHTPYLRPPALFWFQTLPGLPNRHNIAGDNSKFNNMCANTQSCSGIGRGLHKTPALPDGRLAEPDKGWDYNPYKDRLHGINLAKSKKLSTLSEGMRNAYHQHELSMLETIAMETIADRMRSHTEKWLGENQSLTVEPGLIGFAQAKDGGIVLSGSDNQIGGFIPSKELAKAFEKAKSGEPLTFNEEYAVEVLWHEVQHLCIGVSDDHPAAESLIQLAARHSYPQLAAFLGLSVSNQEAIIQNGYGYAENVDNLRWLLNHAGVDEAKAAQETVNIPRQSRGL